MHFLRFERGVNPWLVMLFRVIVRLRGNSRICFDRCVQYPVYDIVNFAWDHLGKKIR